MDMREKIRVWIFVLGLAVVLPGLLLKILPGAPAQEAEQETTSQRQQKQVYIKLLQEDGTYRDVELEEYVRGVVAAEMPEDFEVEALKAQSVLARTYGLKRQAAGDKHPQGALCTQSSCCQAYRQEESYSEKICSAVEATAGLVLTYDGQLIEATYFSCSGGSTEDAAAVWGVDIPYLQATISPGEEHTKHYVTTVQMDMDVFSSRLGVDWKAGGIGVPSYTDGGGIRTVTIGGKEFTGVQLRQLLGLKSTAIQMTVVGDQVIITTKGFGHRVGMSQYGADAMAVAGSTYDQILSYYYQGTLLTRHQP